MILVRKGLIYFVFFAMVGVLLGAGIYGYMIVGRIPAYTPEDAKFLSEGYLFVSLVAALVIFLLFVVLIARSIRLDRELDKIIELNRFQNFSPESSMRELGPLGAKITARPPGCSTRTISAQAARSSCTCSITSWLSTRSNQPSG